MGTDIHGVVQRRFKGNEVYPGGSWETVAEIEDERNYRVFAILAGVRNGVGFAGIYTHEPVKPIQEHRGLPDDFKVEDEYHSWGYETERRRLWMGDHSHGWVALEEVEDWPGWDSTFSERGVMDREEYAAWKASGNTRPKSWAGDTCGGGVLKVQEQVVNGEPFIPTTATHVEAEWSISARGMVGDLFAAWLRYVRLKWGHEHSEVRFVFGFDS